MVRNTQSADHPEPIGNKHRIPFYVIKLQHLLIMKNIRFLLSILLILVGSFTISCHGQIWAFKATHYIYATYNDSIKDYVTWQKGWIECDIPFSIYYIKDTADASHETYRIEFMIEDSVHVNTMVDSRYLDDDVAYERYEDGFYYGSMGYDGNRMLAYSALRNFSKDSMEIWHHTYDDAVHIYRGKLEKGKGLLPINPL